MPVVKMPDGQLVNMPDNPTPEQLAQFKQLSEPSLWETAKHKAKMFGSDVVKGAAALPTLIIDAASIDPTTGKPPEQFGGASAALQDFGEKPVTNADKWQSSITQGVAGAMAGPGGVTAPVRTAIGGAGGGLGAEVAGRLSNDNPFARLAGALVGGAGASGAATFASRAAPQAATLAREALEGLSPEMLTKAKSFQDLAGTNGVTVDLAQALEAVGAPAGNLTTIRNVLANNRSGNRVQETLRNQPTELEMLGDTTVAGLPGSVRQADVAANNVQAAATGRINQAKGERSAAVKPLYEAAGELKPDVRRELADILSEAQVAPGLPQQAASTLAEAQGRLKVSPGTGIPPSHALDFDALIGDMLGPYKGTPLTPPDPRSAGIIKNTAGRMNTALTKASPELKAAEERFSQISRDVVDPLKQGPVGQLATPRGYKPDTAATQSKLLTMLNKGEDPAAGGSNIRLLAKELQKVDPEAFPDALKTYVSGKLGEAFPATIGGSQVTSADAASKVYSALFANRNQWNGLRQAAAASAESMGQKPEDVVRGLENFAQITKALKSRPPSVGGLQRNEVFELSGQNYGADALRVFGFLPFEKAARKIEDAVMARTFTQFDKLLTTPEGAAKLAELGKVPPISGKALALFSAIGAGASADE